MTSDQAPGPMTGDEAHALADQLAAWARTLSDRDQAALGEILARAATAPPGDGDPVGFWGRLLPDPVYDGFFERLQEIAPCLTVPDA